MPTGYTRPLAILPFDHRTSYTSALFGWKEPLNVEQAQVVAQSKWVIYEGFKKAHIPKGEAGILVDEQYGVGIIRDATQRGAITCVSVEASGQDEFEFAYGDDFAQHIEAMQPTFAKVLVRYNPEADRALNRRQTERLQRLSGYLHDTERLFLFELLVPPEPRQLDSNDIDRAASDFAKMIEIDPNNVNGAWMVVYVEMCKARATEQTAERLEAIAQIDPQQDLSHTCAGVALGLRRTQTLWLSSIRLSHRLRRGRTGEIYRMSTSGKG